MNAQSIQRWADREKARAFVIGSGFVGVTITQVRQHIGRGDSVTRQHLQFLNSTGAIERTTETGCGCRYGALGIKEAHRLKRVEKRTQRKKDVFDREPVSRVIPAANAPRIRTRAVNSVWQVGAV